MSLHTVLFCTSNLPSGMAFLLYEMHTAAAKSLQSCPTLCDPIDGSPPGSPVRGFSRQEYWSGLPFPSPMHESEKWKWSHSIVSDSSRPHGLQPSRLLRPWDFLGKSTGVGCHRLLRHVPYLAQIPVPSSCFSLPIDPILVYPKSLQLPLHWPLWMRGLHLM